MEKYSIRLLILTFVYLESDSLKCFMFQDTLKWHSFLPWPAHIAVQNWNLPNFLTFKCHTVAGDNLYTNASADLEGGRGGLDPPPPGFTKG